MVWKRLYSTLVILHIIVYVVSDIVLIAAGCDGEVRVMWCGEGGALAL